MNDKIKKELEDIYYTRVFQNVVDFVSETIDKVRKDEREKILEISIIKEFLESNDRWFESVKKMKIDDYCFVCGIKPYKIEELAKALKKLKDK